MISPGTDRVLNLVLTYEIKCFTYSRVIGVLSSSVPLLAVLLLAVPFGLLRTFDSKVATVPLMSELGILVVRLDETLSLTLF